MQSGRARTASYAHGRSASVACGLGQLKVALRPRSPSSQSGASRIEWKFDFSCREWMDCLVECEQLGSAGSLWCNMFSGGQQTQARERVLKRTLHSNTRDTLEGGYTFFYSGSGPKSTLLATKPKRVGPGVVSLRVEDVPALSRRQKCKARPWIAIFGGEKSAAVPPLHTQCRFTSADKVPP